MPIIQRKRSTEAQQHLPGRSGTTDQSMAVLMGSDAEQTFITAGRTIAAGS